MLWIVVDRLVIREQDTSRIADSLETALRAANGIVEVVEHAAAVRDVDGDSGLVIGGVDGRHLRRRAAEMTRGVLSWPALLPIHAP